MRGKGILKRWAAVALGGVCAATLLALAAPFGWPFELFTHFRVQYAVASLLLLVLFLLLRLPLAALAAAAIAVFNALPLLPATRADAPAAACGGPPVTVVTANLQYSNEDHADFLAWLAAHPADLVVLQEVTASWAAELDRLAAYPHRVFRVREDPYGIGILSRLPLEQVAPEDFARDGVPSLAGLVSVRGKPLRFLALHTRWPVVPELAQARDRALMEVAAFVRADGQPTVAMGDLNLTPYSPVFAKFLAAAGLHDALDGRGWQPTWMAGFWPLALRIDHVLVSGDLCVENASVGPAIGSDHRPVIARLGHVARTREAQGAR